MGPTWDRRDPGGPHVGHMKIAIWDGYSFHDLLISQTTPGVILFCLSSNNALLPNDIEGHI